MIHFRMNPNVRKYTNKLQEMVAEGVLDANAVVNMFCDYCSESDVKDMMQSNDIDLDEETDTLDFDEE